MHMKYFQGLADIESHYDDILYNLIEQPPHGVRLLETWGINSEDKNDIIEEKDVLRYLIGCRFGWLYSDELGDSGVLDKPTLEVVNRCFNRQLGFLERIHKCHAYNVNKYSCKITKRKYKTCRHYLFKFSCPGWVDKLPDRIELYN